MSSEKRKTDWGLRFYLDVLKLESLHFGLWRESDPFNTEGMRSAQKRYTEKLLDMIPESVKSVLDAGCGTGSTSLKLIEKGYDIEVLNPDPYQKSIVQEKLPEEIPYHQEKFEDISGDRLFDLILMSESSQYMDTLCMASRAQERLSGGGYLLIADYFRKSDIPFYRTCKIKDEFQSILKDKGFILQETLDITESTLPTLALGKRLFEEYADPILNIISGYFSEEHPRIKGLSKLLFSKKFQKINRYLYEKMPDKLDEKKFSENMEYIFLLYKKGEE